MDDQKSQQAAGIHQAEYLRLTQAAEKIGSTADKLLHLGAIGKADILAPVLAEGWYEWPVSSNGVPYPDNQVGFAKVKFGIHHRIILTRKDVATIEARGWVTPKAFFSPEAAEEHIVLWKEMKNMPVYERLQKCAQSVPWFAVEPAGPSDAQPQVKEELRITAEHLFISLEEIERLKRNAPQDEGAEERKNVAPELAKPHGNSTRFSNVREEVLMAAIACLFNERKEIKITGAKWAKLVDDKGPLFWKNQNASLTRSEIAKLLNNAKRYPKTPQWEGREEK